MRAVDQKALAHFERGELEEASALLSEASRGVLGGPPALDFLHQAIDHALQSLDARRLGWVLQYKMSCQASAGWQAWRPYLYGLTQSSGFYQLGGSAFSGPGPWRSLFASGGSMSDPRFKACAEALLALPEIHLDAPMVMSGRDGPRPLCQAVLNGDEELVERLLAAGANPGGFWSFPGWSGARPKTAPLEWALRKGRGAIAERLVRAGASAEGLEGLSIQAAKALESALGERQADAKRALRLALSVEGVAKALAQDWSALGQRPLDSLGALEAWLCKKGVEMEGQGGARPAPAKASRVARALGWLSMKSEPDLGAIQARAREGSAEGALRQGDPQAFVERARAGSGEERQALLVGAWALAKASYWRMQSADGVADSGRDAAAWACFKALCQSARKSELEAPIRELGGLSLMGAASALGHADVCSALIGAGAGIDPDPMWESAAPLALAARFGQTRLAMSLLDAGADPFEGCKPGALGYPERGWAIHEALEAGQMELFERLLEADAAQAELKNAQGVSVAQRVEAALRADPEEGGQARWGRALRAIRRGRSRQGEGEEAPARARGPRC